MPSCDSARRGCRERIIRSRARLVGIIADCHFVVNPQAFYLRLRTEGISAGWEKYPVQAGVGLFVASDTLWSHRFAILAARVSSSAAYKSFGAAVFFVRFPGFLVTRRGLSTLSRLANRFREGGAIHRCGLEPAVTIKRSLGLLSKMTRRIDVRTARIRAVDTGRAHPSVETALNN